MEYIMRHTWLAIAILLSGIQTTYAEQLLLAAATPELGAAHVPLNVDAADTTNTDQVQPGGELGLNLTGSGLAVGVWDLGHVYGGHVELAGRVTVQDAATPSYSAHATLVAGTLAASGVSPAAQGMATGVTILSYNEVNDKTELAAAAAATNPDGSPLIVASNHSYGFLQGWVPGIDWGIGTVDTWASDRAVYAAEDPDFGRYGADAQATDQALYDNPHLLSVWAAGNDRDETYTNARGDGQYVTYLSTGVSGAGWYLVSAGTYAPPPSDGNGGLGYDSLAEEQTAKNTLVVGSVDDITQDPYTGADVAITSYSSWGPTDDGRIKPDVVASGENLYSSSYTSSASTADYVSDWGTSMSAASVTGSAVLLIEHYQNLHGAIPRSATTKGLVIHTATDAGNAGPDYSFGWGVMNTAAAAQFLTDHAAGLSNAQLIEGTYAGNEITLDVWANGYEPLKATLCWTDPAGAVQPEDLDNVIGPALVNDLDIWITDDAGNTYRPWTLDPLNPDDAAVRDQLNHLDNVEQVFIGLPERGLYTIHIGRTGDAFTQDFSLLISGTAIPEPAPLLLALTALALRRKRR
jgi:subtilase family protein